MITSKYETQSLSSIKAIGSFEVLPQNSDPDNLDNMIIFNLGLGNEPRGIYIRNADDSYTMLNVDPGYKLLSSLAAAETVAGNTEQNIIDLVIPGGTLGTTNQFRIMCGGRIRNFSGTIATAIFRVYYGTTILYQDTTANLSTNNKDRSVWMSFLLSGQSSETSQDLSGLVAIGGTGASVIGRGDLGSDEITSHAPIDGAGAVDSTIDQQFRVTVQFSASNANLYMNRYRALAEIIG